MEFFEDVSKARRKAKEAIQELKIMYVVRAGTINGDMTPEQRRDLDIALKLEKLRDRVEAGYYEKP